MNDNDDRYYQILSEARQAAIATGLSAGDHASVNREAACRLAHRVEQLERQLRQQAE